MKQTTLIFIFAVFSAMAWGQGSVSRIAFTSGGRAASHAGITIGEPILGRNAQVTLGSQQGIISSPTVGIKEIDGSSVVKVFPNPFTSEFTVTVNGEAANNFAVKVVDVIGREILSEAGLSHSYNGNLGSFPKGAYFITVINSKQEKIISKTLIKI